MLAARGDMQRLCQRKNLALTNPSLDPLRTYEATADPSEKGQMLAIWRGQGWAVFPIYFGTFVVVMLFITQLVPGAGKEGIRQRPWLAYSRFPRVARLHRHRLGPLHQLAAARHGRRRRERDAAPHPRATLLLLHSRGVLGIPGAALGALAGSKGERALTSPALSTSKDGEEL
jgi:hypothetical protein